MKTLYSFLLVSLFPLLASSQTHLYVDSTCNITAQRCCTNIRYAIPTADKGVLFVGEAFNSPGGMVPNSIYAGQNVMVGKIDSNHQVSWIKIYGGNGVDAGTSASQTPDGGYAILCGTTSSDGNVTGYKGGGGDIWLLKVDATGNLLWERTYGSSWQDYPISIANSPDNGFIILGGSNGSGGDIPFHYSDMWTFDWVVIRTDNLGNLQWCKDLGGTDDEGGTGAILSVDSSYYLISNSFSKDHDCTDTVWHSRVNTNADVYILKLDQAGNVLWDSSYGGSNTEYVSSALFDTRDSTIVVNGTTGSNDYMVSGYTNGMGDMWVVKFRKDGTLLWQKPLGNTQETRGAGICKGYDGGYAVCGSVFTGPIGNEDVWLFILDAVGNVVADKIFGGFDPDDPSSVVPFLNGYVVTGTGSQLFTEGICDTNNSGGFVSYIDSVPVSAVNNISASPELLRIFPNPASEHLNLWITGKTTGNLICLNTMGQKVLESRIEEPGNKLEIAIAGWQSGVYFLNWLDDHGNTETIKFIKN